MVFLGLGSTVFSYLWLKSRYIPRSLAIVGIVAAAWCALCTIIYLIDPAFAGVVPSADVWAPEPLQPPATSWYGGLGVMPPVAVPVVRLSMRTVSAERVVAIRASRAAMPS